MEKNKPTDSQIQVLMSDWLGTLRLKDEGNYVHKGRGGIRRLNSTPTSEYLLDKIDDLDQIELIKQGRKASCQVVNAIVSEQAEVVVGGNESFHARQNDKHYINLATDYFDDYNLAKREKIDIMLGLAAHEAAHAAYTESAEVEKRILREPEYLRELKQHVWNIIEDERIEYHLGEDSPGFAELIAATKGYYFGKLGSQIRSGGDGPTEELPRFLNALTCAVRYPSQMTYEDAEENFDDLDAIRRVLTPFPMTPEATWDATERIMSIIHEKAKKKAQEQKQQQQQQQQQQSQGKQGQESTNQQGAAGTDKDKSGKSPSPTKKEIEDALKSMLGTQEAQKVMQAIKEDNSKGKGNNCSCEIKNDPQSTDYVNDDTAERTGTGNGACGKYIFKPKGCQELYLSELRNVRAYIPAMAKTLACKSQETDYELHGLPSGKLNTNKLASLKMGNRNIFDKKGSVTCSGASVVMLIDESGSMSSNHNMRMLAARRAAILINEAVSRIRNVNFYCYGFSTVGFNVYAEPGRTSKWALSDTSADGGTPTGAAMQIAAERVRRKTQDPCLMLVLTDGAAGDSRLVIQQDSELRKDKFFPIGVGIQDDAVRKTFKEYIVMHDISELALEMGKVTKNKLDRMMIRRDSSEC